MRPLVEEHITFVRGGPQPAGTHGGFGAYGGGGGSATHVKSGYPPVRRGMDGPSSSRVPPTALVRGIHNVYQSEFQIPIQKHSHT